MKIINRYLGRLVADKVTGFKGVVSCVSFDLYGCVQALVTPLVGNDGKLGDSSWFDVSRLTVTPADPVMPLPDFDNGPISDGSKGPAEKPTGRLK